MIDPKIMEKVSEAEKEAPQLERCLRVYICPKCGSTLHIYLCEDGDKMYSCSNPICPFKRFV